MEFTKTRHVLEAMCEGAVMPVRDTPWEGWTLLALAGASEDLSTDRSSAPHYFCSIIFHPSSRVSAAGVWPAQSGPGRLASHAVSAPRWRPGRCQPWALVEACGKTVGLTQEGCNATSHGGVTLQWPPMVEV